jgi:hypothetical protein
MIMAFLHDSSLGRYTHALGARRHCKVVPKQLLESLQSEWLLCTSIATLGQLWLLPCRSRATVYAATTRGKADIGITLDYHDGRCGNAR